MPGLGLSSGEALCCARCGSALETPSDPHAENSSEPLDGNLDVPLDDEARDAETSSEWDPAEMFEQWDELSSQMQRVERIVGGVEHIVTTQPSSAEGRLDVTSSARRAPASVSQPPLVDHRAKSWFGWMATCLGLTGLVCGAVLLAWAAWGHRPELWTLGLPVALISQAVLIFGLLSHLDRMRAVQGQTVDQLERLDRQLDEVRHAAAHSGPAWRSASHDFYCHLADGAAPQTLLADLKSQLDLLAVKIREP